MCILCEEEVPCIGDLTSAEYLYNITYCSTKGDGTTKTMTEDDERIDMDMEMALALAMEGTIRRRLEEEQTARGRMPRVSIAWDRELQSMRHAELRDH